MKANEFRTGNFVLSPTGKVCVVEEIRQNVLRLKAFDGSVFMSMHDECEPIPLTEEWSLKFGFKKLHYKGLIYYKKKHSQFELSEDMLYESGIDCIVVSSVHQLQNLFFALTGEELVVKEKATS